MPILLLLSAAGATTLSGDFLTIHYNDGGTWNNSTDGAGFVATIGGQALEFTYQGVPYQAVGVGYDKDGVWTTSLQTSAGTSEGVVLASEDVSSPGIPAYRWVWSNGDVEVEKIEWFDERDVSVAVQLTVTNVGDTPVEHVELVYTLDPDQDATVYGDYTTVETVGDTNDDGADDWASASGPTSGVTIGLGACSAEDALLGFFSTWQSESPIGVTLTDPAGAAGDDAMALQLFGSRALAPGEDQSFRFVVGVDADASEAEDAYLALAAEICCDQDGDGAAAAACGGPDCDDGTAAYGPDVVEVPYDGVDQDCSGGDANDLDADGQIGAPAGGPDCDDADPAVSTVQAEVWYDGIDQNCDGNDDDQDFDGAVLAYDCDDEDPSIQEGCPEPDDDTDGAVETTGGCGCASAPDVAGLGLGAAGLAAIVRRRRRA